MTYNKMQAWITKVPPWVYWAKMLNGDWIKFDFGNMKDAQNNWDMDCSSGATLSIRPGFQYHKKKELQ